MSLEICGTLWSAHAGLWSRTLFYWDQITQTVAAKSSGCCPWLIIHERASLKFWNWIELQKPHSSELAQAISSSLHDHMHGVDFLRYQGSGHTMGLQWWYVEQGSPLLAWHFDKLAIVSSSFFVAHAWTISPSKVAYHGMKVAVKKAILIPPLETCSETYNCTFHHVSWAKSYYLKSNSC